jgi:putative ABC transport system permease protein
MKWTSKVRKLFRTIVRRSTVESDMQTEMDFHIQSHAEELMRDGVPADEALRRARIEFGSQERYKEDCRESLGMRHWDEFRGDVRYTVRMLRKSPGVTVIAVITLALGIGANTAIFSIVDAALLRPLPYKAPERLVTLERVYPHDYSYNLSIPNFSDVRQQGEHLFESASAHDVLPSGLSLTTTGVPQRLSALRVSANFFQTLGVEPNLGRSFAPEEDKAGNDSVIILSHRLWQNRFGSDPSIVGRTLVLNARPYTVVGVLPAGFKFIHDTDVWSPLVLETTSQDRKANIIETVARLRSGVSVESARAEVKLIGKLLQQQYGTDNSGFDIGLMPFQQRTAGEVRTPMLVLLGAVVLVLLVACANVANLLLAQSAGRQREIALRAALGASRGRIARQLLTESVLLAFAGMAAGLLFARWATAALLAFSPANIALINEVKLDARVLTFAVLVALVTGIAFGSAPALHAVKLDLNEVLKKGGRTGNNGPRRRLRSALVISEVAIALVLSIGAGLLIESFVRLLKVDPGYNPKSVLDLQMPLPDTRFKTATELANYYRQFLPKVATLPGVESAAVSTTVPLDLCPDFPVNIEGRAMRDDEQPDMIYVAASADYFRTLQIPVMRGRAFTEADNENSTAVVIISEGAAKKWWPDGNAIGQHIWIAKSMGPQFADAGPREIVGVVGDVHNDTLRDAPRATTYVPLAQVHSALVPLLTRLLPLNVVVRTSGEPLAAAASVEKQIWAVDSQQSVSEVRSLEHIARQSLAMERFVAWLLGTFGSLVLLLAAVGIYGVISYSVTQRANEIGVRMALGASRGRVLRMVVGDGLRLTLIGIGTGLVLALALTRIVQTLLFGVRPWEPGIYCGIALLLSLVAITASLLPARRAMGVDPMVALRYE